MPLKLTHDLDQMSSLFYLFTQQRSRRRRPRNKFRPFRNNLRPLLPRDQIRCHLYPICSHNSVFTFVAESRLEGG
jgi:hypothetical protein